MEAAGDAIDQITAEEVPYSLSISAIDAYHETFALLDIYPQSKDNYELMDNIYENDNGIQLFFNGSINDATAKASKAANGKFGGDTTGYYTENYLERIAFYREVVCTHYNSIGDYIDNRILLNEDGTINNSLIDSARAAARTAAIISLEESLSKATVEFAHQAAIGGAQEVTAFKTAINTALIAFLEGAILATRTATTLGTVIDTTFITDLEDVIFAQRNAALIVANAARNA
jgi:hypothetical protein